MLLYFKDTAELERALHIATLAKGHNPRSIAQSLIRDSAQAGSDKLDEAVRMVRALKGAEVDACACGTSRDWDTYHKLNDQWGDFSAELTEVK